VLGADREPARLGDPWVVDARDPGRVDLVAISAIEQGGKQDDDE
jgi:hypothetical protein